jgi:hypothetical protein
MAGDGPKKSAGTTVPAFFFNILYYNLKPSILIFGCQRKVEI